MSEELIDHAAWGERFFATAVTAERVLAGVNVLAGRPIDVGPLGVGPGRIAKVTATGTIGTATGERIGADPVSFQVDLPVALRFTVDLGMDKQRFDAEITVPLVITAHGRADLAIVLDVTPPRSAQVVVRLRAQGLRASLTSRAANVEGELRRFVARYVAKELEKPYVRSATTIDVRAAVEKAAAGLGPRDDSAMAHELTDELPAAIEAELAHTAQLLLEDDE
ncbi:hypothetical protein [Nocardioides daeguensis]|uniref:DUF4403 family protein n=1 Tax=Nocardioides daeguensis TaxID=908359 RepID=A0ABP6UU48_9ACTN|nr:hypothetical protein [Nocardioides daeguensis]MBV6725881.1 hypothetical protein [Nocardioides daeguensis]MCR1772604.1 hypothetical protein [Nocardioides daeguensis]